MLIRYVNSCNLEAYWKAIKGILKYLSGTLEFGLVLRKASTATALDLVGFCDANRASDKDDRRSTSGYRVYLGPKLIAWQSQKQHTFSRSSTEAEYRSLANLIAEMSWLQSLLGELQVKCTKAPVIWCDNLSTVMLATNSILHAKTKHIKLDLNFVKE